MDTEVKILAIVLTMASASVLGQSVADSVAVDEKAGDLPSESRMLIGDDKMEWIGEMSGKLIIAKRAVGPFGLVQDPDAEVEKPQALKIEKGAFIDAIAAMNVNTVMPKDDKFTIGTREFVEGDKFPLIKNNRQFNVEIVAVNSGSILFKNTDSGKLVKKSLNSLPAGMARRSSLMVIPGVSPASQKNSNPLNLDANSLPVTNE